MEETLTPGVDGAEEEEEEAGKPKPLLPPRELLGKIWFLLAFNVGASRVGRAAGLVPCCTWLGTSPLLAAMMRAAVVLAFANSPTILCTFARL